MPTYVLEMSTDQDIINTGLHVNWNPVIARHDWQQVAQGGQNIPAGSTIVVIAHGNGQQIGNAHGAPNIDPEWFLTLVQNTMTPGVQPVNVYISTCGTGIAEFTANVAILADQNAIWANAGIFGHHDQVAGIVPPSTALAWTQIFP